MSIFDIGQNPPPPNYFFLDIIQSYCLKLLLGNLTTS